MMTENSFTMSGSKVPTTTSTNKQKQWKKCFTKKKRKFLMNLINFSHSHTYTHIAEVTQA